ncbi:ROK family protein [Loigolactobacillus zhaoyuanensis]|uniref:ROK family protein n=1 Tax=Loigolactobacillus zhaoyuanensis TaxID=2486017 RepID=UPI000F73AB2D|nr:ROK family protein [Loigolactobacillus zhaoyuanensis]
MHITDIKRNNKKNILKVLYSKGLWSKRRIANRLNLSPSVVTRLCGELLDQKIIIPYELIESPHAGRRETKIDINPDYKYGVGISINNKSTALLLTDLKLNPIATRVIATNQQPQLYFDKLITAITALVADNQLTLTDLLGIGISIKGKTDGTQSYYGVWEQPVDVKTPLTAALHLPVFIDNGVRCSAIATQLRHAKKDFVMMKYIEAGIGAAVVRNSELLYGQNHSLAEIGHTIIDPSQDYCPICKRKGCLESIISIERLIDNVRANFSLEKTPVLWENCLQDATKITLDTIIEAADAGSIYLNNLLKRNAELFAIAVINAKVIFDINDFVIIGNLFKSQKFTAYFNAALNQYQLSEINGNISIRTQESNQLSAVALLINQGLLEQLN